MSQTVDNLKTDLKNEVHKNLERLQTLRDEVRVKLHLAGMEAKDRWNELEPHLADAERTAQQIGEVSRDALAQAVEKLEAFRASLK